ncbi:hypothetical protein [Pantoea agglomerans]|jgi:hypothetical protein|uniref:hypothetical protein n=1 Tax=Enterobacter agglomerans TaxID=549 RepID=UPI001F5B3855|nr:hypothetical protein [Pantoea agglomerans]MCX2202778.1 hypothetical protein [Pantoea agglomerans]
MLVLVVQHGDKASGNAERLAGWPDKFLKHVVAAIVIARKIHQHGTLRPAWFRCEIRKKCTVMDRHEMK